GWQQAMAQSSTVSGTVSSADDGQPLPGASVIIKGTTQGVITDFDGKYSLDISGQSSAVLVVSFVGMETQEIAVGAQSIIDAVLESDSKQLEEVVVTAMGVSREKASLGYAMTSVGSEVLEQSSTTNFIDALNGKVAGIQITNSGGQAGSGTNMLIRGYSSINFNNQPLIVVDGIPIDNDATSSNSSGSSQSTGFAPANRGIDINPDDIATMSVLKGGAATALYGSRAANGALVITTKSGSKEKKGLSTTYSFSHSVEEANKFPEQTDKFARGREGSYANFTHWSWGPAYDSNPVFPDGTIINLTGEGDIDASGQPIPFYANNLENAFVKGSTTNHNVGISGGNENGAFYASFSNLDQKGIIENSTYQRTSALINASRNVTKNFSVSGKANYVKTNTHRVNMSDFTYGVGYLHHMWDIRNFNYKSPSGEPTWFSTTNNFPMWVINEQGEDGMVDRLIGGLDLKYEVAPWLNLQYRVGLDTYTDQRNQVRPIGSKDANDGLGDITEIRLVNRSFNHDFIVNGAYNLNEDFELSYLVGSNIYTNLYNRLYVRGDGIVLPGYEDVTNTENQVVTRSLSEKMTIGVYGDVTLGYKHFLYLGLTGRNDWSSTLPLDNNSYFYPSANLGFVFSELIQNDALNFGKFRLSYSQVANDAPFASLYNVYVQAANPSVHEQLMYFIDNNLNNPNLRPERSSEIELGLELALVRNKINLDLAYYDKESRDQMIWVPVSEVTGYEYALQNVGLISNKGIEAMLNFDNLVKVGDLNWDLTFNFTKNVGLVEKVSDELESVYLSSASTLSDPYVALRATEGEAYGAIYGYAYSRTEDGELIIDEATGYPEIDSEESILGNINPDWTLGINLGLEYKGLKLGALIERKQGGDVMNTFEAMMVYSGLSKQTEQRYYSADDPYANATVVFDGVNYDEETGTYTKNTTMAKLTNVGYYQQNFRLASENFVEDASWWRLRSVSLAYDLPSKLMNRIPFVQGLQVGFVGRNLWLLTKYSGFDPESNSNGPGNYQGIQSRVVPNTRSYEVNLKVKF
ncbi:SusC/RagA family TonB-linked outer membrane protein, partial [Xanthovirga aplysinae]|uniref:SusC/RagA family TonB-linked outer membrane protein n=1 Tax=Xanthovirga aplysinae TaxID=2529853 RepID=UPI0012BCEE5D